MVDIRLSLLLSPRPLRHQVCFSCPDLSDIILINQQALLPVTYRSASSVPSLAAFTATCGTSGVASIAPRLHVLGNRSEFAGF
jgi:hypothetical protein